MAFFIARGNWTQARMASATGPDGAGANPLCRRGRVKEARRQFGRGLIGISAADLEFDEGNAQNIGRRGPGATPVGRLAQALTPALALALALTPTLALALQTMTLTLNQTRTPSPALTLTMTLALTMALTLKSLWESRL